MSLTGKQRRHLRSLGHHLDPVVIVGDAGPSPGVVAQVDVQLTAHELIKVKAHEGSREEMQEIAATLAKGSKSEVAQVMGHTILLYRPHPKTPRISLP